MAAKKAPSKKAPAEKAASEKAASNKASAEKASAEKASAKKASPKKASAKNAEAKSSSRVGHASAEKEAPGETEHATPQPRLSEGDSLPALVLLDQDEQSVALAELRGPAILYFYPKDNTPGCTKEACGFQAALAQIAAAGAQVYGISPDSPASHRKFRAAQGLTFPLLADTDRAATQAFGCWVMKTMMGRKGMGVERSTFLIDRDGKLARVWRGVRVDGHVEAVLAALAAL